ncbi:putative serine/threonine-kinase pknI domain protein [Mycobacterium kansasii]|uniref:Putative serine/threonine-kinase pknI domain protein n=1 Tax=Mycobacterium kansasii TaxID=1768 RepID=A0A1V3XUK8_MYCKA|nr:putative serine/threonine-kinase pknI domain protein [Mycobacterium kansasii]
MWSLSSSMVAAARQPVGVHEDRIAHQVLTSGGCGLGV